MMRSLYKKQRDLGVLYNVVSGEQSSNSADDSKYCISTSDTSAEEAAGPSSEYKTSKIFHIRPSESLYEKMLGSGSIVERGLNTILPLIIKFF